jgi:hypothetical protein
MGTSARIAIGFTPRSLVMNEVTAMAPARGFVFSPEHGYAIDLTLRANESQRTGIAFFRWGTRERLLHIAKIRENQQLFLLITKSHFWVGPTPETLQGVEVECADRDERWALQCERTCLCRQECRCDGEASIRIDPALDFAGPWPEGTPPWGWGDFDA